MSKVCSCHNWRKKWEFMLLAASLYSYSSTQVTNRKFTKIVTQYNWIFLTDERMLFFMTIHVNFQARIKCNWAISCWNTEQEGVDWQFMEHGFSRHEKVGISQTNINMNNLSYPAVLRSLNSWWFIIIILKPLKLSKL